jgi:hypothetical protein
MSLVARPVGHHGDSVFTMLGPIVSRCTARVVVRVLPPQRARLRVIKERPCQQRFPTMFSSEYGWQMPLFWYNLSISGLQTSSRSKLQGMKSPCQPECLKDNTSPRATETLGNDMADLLDLWTLSDTILTRCSTFHLGVSYSYSST